MTPPGDRRLRLPDLRIALFAAAATLVLAAVAGARHAAALGFHGYLRWRTTADFVHDVRPWAIALAAVSLLQGAFAVALFGHRRRVYLMLAFGWLAAALGVAAAPAAIRLAVRRLPPDKLPAFARDAASMSAYLRKIVDAALLPDRLWLAFAGRPGAWLLLTIGILALGLLVYTLLHFPLRRWSAAEAKPAGWASWLIPAAAIAVAGGLPALDAAILHPAAAGRPDVILVSIDTLRLDGVGVYGAGPSVTPNLDRLAAMGARLTGVRAPSSWTVPSHAAMLTGRWPWSLGVFQVADAISPRAATLAAALSARGYDAFAVVTNLFVDAPYGFGKGFSRVAHPASERAVDAVAVAQAWLARRPADRPAFLFLHLYDAHWPYRPPTDAPDWIFGGTADADRREVSRHQDAFELATALRAGSPALTAAARALYRGAIWGADRELGKLFAAIAERGRPAYVIVTADHGELFGEHEMYGHGVTLFEEEIRVPWLVVGPGVPAGAIVDGPASLVDVAPTIAEFAGLPGELPQADGRSLAAAIRQGGPLPARWLAGENRSLSDVPARYVSDGVWKWFSGLQIRVRGAEVAFPAAAHQVNVDPHELTQRLGDPAAPDFAAAAEELFRHVGASARRAPLDPAERERLHELGYLP
jgi:arylsulfatase A-like enzyme